MSRTRRRTIPGPDRRWTRWAALPLLAVLEVACAEVDREVREVLDTGDSAVAAPSIGLDSALTARAIEAAAELPRLRSLLIARHGELLHEEYRGSSGADRYANIKSASKSVLSALVGIAIAEGHLDGVDQRVVPFFPEYVPDDGDARLTDLTIGDLLSMRSGLRSTSMGNYGDWVTSSNWVRYVLNQPMVDEPGGRMLYSTGSSHLLSAILTRATGRSTLQYAREKLAQPLGIDIPAWTADPQGIYFGGNEMSMTPRDMLAFGEMYRNAGSHEGVSIVPEGWVETSWRPRTVSPYNGYRYGYGWWSRRAGDREVYFAWGYGGQFIFIVPDLELTVVTTSDPNAPRAGRHLRAVHGLLDDFIIPAAERGGAVSVPADG